jgi:hypothetical protein
VEIQRASVTAGAGPPTLPNMFDLYLGDRAGVWRRLGIGLLGIAVVGLGIWGFMTRAVGEHVTDCGFDSDGAYAKVRVNNLFGGAHEQDVHVTFHLNGDVMQVDYDDGLRSAHLPAHGAVTTVVHGRFPPLRMFLGATAVDSDVRGRTIYRWEGRNVSLDPPHDWMFVSKTFAAQHPGRTSAEAVPDDPSMLHCSTSEED